MSLNFRSATPLHSSAKLRRRYIELGNQAWNVPATQTTQECLEILPLRQHIAMRMHIRRLQPTCRDTLEFLTMMSPLLSLMILAFFAPWGAYAELSTTTICRMGFGTTSTRTIRTRTTTVRSVSTSTLLVLSYPTRTITPPVVTQTSSASKTITATRTADQDTTTITITLREAALTTTTSTSFLTVPTVTTTTTTLLADVPSFSTSPGFMPIQSVHGNLPERKRKLLPPVENNDLESALPLIEDDSLVRRQ
jgi:hypothetical protein